MIEYHTGDLFEEAERWARPICIAHVCNNVGAWGAGFTKGLSTHYPKAETAFREWAASRAPGLPAYGLGATQVVRGSDNVWVANMVAQVGVGRDRQRIDYRALEACLVQAVAAGPYAAFLVPRLGCGLAGGSWARVEEILGRVFASGPRIIVCTRPGERFNP